MNTTTENLKMNPSELYREDIYTDRRVGSIRELTPINTDGTRDNGRKISYVGQASLLTPMGALPLNFEINAASLKEAVDNFADAAKLAVDRTLKELEELRRDNASSLIIPEVGPSGQGPGRLGGGGKIQLR